MIKTIFGNEEQSNSFVICRFDSCMIIDPSHDLNKIDDIIEHRKVLGILITHAHNDHVDLIHHYDVPIYIHKDDAHLLFEDAYNGYAPNKHPYKRKELDIKLIEDGQKIPLADQFVEVIHTPGHTKGSVSFLYLNHLFTGDTLFKESVGRHDLYSGNLPELKQSILKMMSLNNEIKIYPGHDELTTMRYEKKNNPFYIKWAKQFKKLR